MFLFLSHKTDFLQNYLMKTTHVNVQAIKLRGGGVGGTDEGLKNHRMGGRPPRWETLDIQ